MKASECSELAKHQFPDDPEPDGRIRWAMNCKMEVAERIVLELLTYVSVWKRGDLRDAVYRSPAWDIAESSCIGLALGRMEDAGKIDTDAKGWVTLP